MPQPVQHQQVRPHRHPHPATTHQTSLERHRRKCAVCHHPERESIEEEFLHWHNPVNIVHEFDLGDRRILYRHAHATGLYEQRRRNYLFTIENVLECGEDIEFTAAAYIKAVRAYACLCDTVRWNEPVTRVTHDYHVHTDSSGHDAPRNSARGTGSQPVRSSASLQTPATDSSFPALCLDQKSAITNDVSIARASQPSSLAKGTKGLTKGSAPASAVSSEDSGEKFLAAAIPLLGGKPKHVAQLKKAGLLDLAELAARHVSPISNRHNLELESPVTSTKQTPEAISNRHKFTK